MGHQGLALSGISNIRYQLCVVACDVGELVDLAGGWICDRTLAAAAVSGAAINNTENLYSSAPCYDASTNHDDHRLAVGQAGDRGEGAQ
jgi:hypothetical protein